MVCRCVQLVLPLIQTMQDFSFVLGSPPHKTNLPPGRRERLCLVLCPGKSGMEHVSEEGRGKISTEERQLLQLEPPTNNCPDAKMVKVKDHTKRIKKHPLEAEIRNLFIHFSYPPIYKCPDTKLIKDQESKDEESICSLVSWLLLWHRLETKKRDRKTRTRARMIVKLNS